MTDLLGRVLLLREYAARRIEVCRDIEYRFNNRVPREVLDSVAERLALQAVLEILDGKDAP